MTWRAISARSIAYHVIDTGLYLSVLSHVASYDVPINICQALHYGGFKDVCRSLPMGAA